VCEQLTSRVFEISVESTDRADGNFQGGVVSKASVPETFPTTSVLSTRVYKALLIVTLLWIAFSSESPASATGGGSSPQVSKRDKPTKNTAPLSTEEIAIYKAVLQEYVRDGGGMLNVSATTEPLDPKSPMNHLSDSECLKGIQLENLDTVTRSFHDLTPDVLPGKNMKLVDPKNQGKLVRHNDPSKTIRGGKSVDAAVKDAFATGLFSMSEIAFDKEHHHAVVSYGFWCGGLCGNGATLVFEKVGENWKRTDRNCGGWVS